ncbi:MAG: NnrS family protein [Magnetococcales bacterium]|nr:NnrS family protein [Magnetococcales bacterium]
MNTRLFPIAAAPPPTPITREPTAHRFWGGGLVALLLGFGLGVYLWCQQWGIFPFSTTYPDWRLLHAKVQFLLFTGSFVLGFALQAGPHVIGGTPPDSRSILRLLFPLWFGFLLGLLPDPTIRTIGNVLITLAFAGAAFALVGVMKSADRQRALPVGIPLVTGIAAMGAAPWLPLDQPDVALAALLAGPVSCILAVVQHLVANILGGRRPMGTPAHLFTAAWLIAWLAAWGSAVQRLPWALTGPLWAFITLWLIVAVRLFPVLRGRPLESIVLTLVIGLLALPLAGMLLFFGGHGAIDPALHLVSIGMVATMILGVTARVAGFFSGGFVMHDRLLSILLLAWLGVVALRTVVPLGILAGERSVLAASLLATVLLLFWVVRVGWRLLVFGRRAAAGK